jgi:uncharacterized protein (TIGR02145 family)
MLNKITLIIFFIILHANDAFTQIYGSFSDVRDGKVYKSVKIGNQTWMAENLNVGRFMNGDSIPEVKTPEEWEAARQNREPAWCYYNNDPANGAKYGRLYNWYAVFDPRKLAPYGWHITSDREWTTLSKFLGGEKVAGGKIKSKNLWKDHGYVACTNCFMWSQEKSKQLCSICKNQRYIYKALAGNGSNISGLNALPGGFFSNDSFNEIGERCIWWTKTETGIEGESFEIGDAWGAFIRELSNHNNSLTRYGNDKSNGFFVRCIKD